MQIFTFIGRHYFWRWSHMLSDFDPFFFSPSAIFSAFGDFFRLRRLFPPSAVAPQFFVIFHAKPGESGLGTLLKRTAFKFCIEWSNRELLRPSRRRDMAISLFQHGVDMLYVLFCAWMHWIVVFSICFAFSTTCVLFSMCVLFDVFSVF